MMRAPLTLALAAAGLLAAARTVGAQGLVGDWNAPASLGALTSSDGHWTAGPTARLATGLAPGQLPPPVDLGIQNIPQQTPVWCWAAVAQQIIAAVRGPAQTPPQCALVAVANGVHPDVCCVQQNAGCVRTGALQQIQGLIAQFGGRISAVAPPTDPMTLYQTLANGRAIILQIRSGQANHVVVLRGMAFQPTPMGVMPVLFINDPLAIFTQPVPFPRLMGMWVSAIVVG